MRKSNGSDDSSITPTVVLVTVVGAEVVVVVVLVVVVVVDWVVDEGTVIALSVVELGTVTGAEVVVEGVVGAAVDEVAALLGAVVEVWGLLVVLLGAEVDGPAEVDSVVDESPAVVWKEVSSIAEPRSVVSEIASGAADVEVADAEVEF